MKIIGLDLSLRATGYADEDGARVITSKSRGMPRLSHLLDQIELASGVRHLLDDPRAFARPDLVVIEDYAFSRGDAHAHALGELGGVIKLALHEAGVATVLISPSALKKFATGKGNANKVAMATAATRAGYDGADDDNCIDAWWLREMALYRLSAFPSHPLSETAYRDEAVSKVEWPTLEPAVTP